MARQRWPLLAFVAGGALLLLLLASSLHDVVLQPGRPIRLDMWFSLGRTATRPAAETSGSPLWFQVVVGAAVIFFIFGLIFSRSLRRELLRNLPIYLLMVFGLYLLSRTLTQNNAPRGEAPSIGEMAEQPPVMQGPSLPEYVNQPPEWMVIAVTAVIALVLLGVLLLVIRRLRKPPEPLERLVAEVREALEDLRAGGDLRDTITRCYAEMVNVFRQSRGMGRDQTLTPREFEQRLAAAGLDDSHVQRLTRLFELVRYSPRTPGEREEREAQECLEAIVAAYGKKEQGPPMPSARAS